MLIIGAKGFAKEVLEIFDQNAFKDDLSFFDDISNDLPELLFERFKILRKFEDIQDYFKNVSSEFALGIGNPIDRNNMFNKLIKIGGVPYSTISPFAKIGHFGNYIGRGVNIMTGTIITNDIVIQDGVLINLNCTIGHDSHISSFAELSPGVHISGKCHIGSHSVIGTGAVLLPKIKIGKNVTIGAGSVVNKNIEDNSVAVGVPAKVIKKQNPLVLNKY